MTDDPHIHLPCSRCGVVEAEVDGLCAECAELEDGLLIEHTMGEHER